MEHFAKIKSYMLFLGYFVIILILLISAFTFPSFNIPLDWITQDAASSQKFNPFIGFISNLGAILWSFTVAICLFTAFIKLSYNDIKSFIFLLFTGLLSFILLIDDLFEFHEFVFPRLLKIPEAAIFLGYFICLILYSWFFIKQILRFNYIIFILAVVFFGASIIQDRFFNDFSQFLEDSLKFIGIFTWFCFFASTCYSLIVVKSFNDSVSE